MIISALLAGTIDASYASETTKHKLPAEVQRWIDNQIHNNPTQPPLNPTLAIERAAKKPIQVLPEPQFQISLSNTTSYPLALVCEHKTEGRLVGLHLPAHGQLKPLDFEFLELEQSDSQFSCELRPSQLFSVAEGLDGINRRTVRYDLGGRDKDFPPIGLILTWQNNQVLWKADDAFNAKYGQGAKIKAVPDGYILTVVTAD